MKTRIKRIAESVGAAVCLAAVTSTGYAGLNAYEPFNYTSIPNGTASTATGFTGNWTCGTTPTVITGLTYTGLPTANSALSSTSGRQFESFSAPFSS
jgi:hypothetical protein